MAQTLLALTELIARSTARIDEVCKAKGTSFPSLDEPFTAASEEIRADPAVARAIAVAAAAAEQLIATIWQPASTVAYAALGVRDLLQCEQHSQFKL